MKAIVTGGAGMIGSALADYLANREDWEVYVIDNYSRGRREFVRNKNITAKICWDLSQRMPEGLPIGGDVVVFHFAARVGGVGRLGGGGQWRSAYNAVIDWNVIQWCTNLRIPLLYVSSAAVYPQFLQDGSHSVYNESIWLREDDMARGFERDTVYGWQKVLAEETVLSAVKEDGLVAKIVRLFNVYGPRGIPEDGGHVIPTLVHRALTQTGALHVWGDGSQSRSFIYVEDVVKAVDTVMKFGQVGEVYNVGVPEHTTIEKLARTLLTLLGETSRDVRFDTSKPVGVHSRRPDIDKIRSLGWSPAVPLFKGLDKTIGWMREWIRDVEEAQRIAVRTY